jgi:hypothetical protein
MATFVTHGLIGAALRGGVVSLCGAPEAVVIAAASLGAVEGMAPRWQLYTWFHQDAPWEWGLVFWGWGLHRLFDIPFHQTPGEKWWPRLWWLELGGGIGSLVLLWWVLW